MLLSALLAAMLAQAQPDRTISGAVVDEEGKPVAGARVVIHAPPMTWGKENAAVSETATDAEGRYRLKVPPFGRRMIGGIRILAYRPGLAIAATSFYRHPEPYVLKKPVPRTIRVEGPDARPIAGARVTPRVLSTFDWPPTDVPGDLADAMAVTTGPDGRATIPYLTARDQLGAVRIVTDSIGAQDLPLMADPRRGSSEPVIAVRLNKTSRLSGRVVDEARRPVAGQEVEVWSRGDGGWLHPNQVAFAGGPLRTGADGSFRTPDNLMVGSSYRVVVRGPGKEAVLSDWMTIGEPPRALLPIRLGSLRTVAGQVVDRQGKPVAGVEVFQSGDGPEPTSTRTGPDGRFALGGFRHGPVFLFARGEGVRFHGQLIRADQAQADVALTRTGERPTRAMHILPAPIPAEESRALAVRLAEPVWKAVAGSGDDRTKYNALEALADADPAGTLEKLESARFAHAIWDFRARTAIARAMVEADPEEAATVAEAIADPGPRASALIALIDALPAGHRDRRAALLDRATPHARAEPDAAKRLRMIGDLAWWWYRLGNVEKARALFAEGLRIANQMPDKRKYERASFAAQITPVDPDAALAIAADFKGRRPGGSFKVVWGLEVIARDPSDGVFFWKATNDLPMYPAYGSIAWKLARVDPARARRIIEGIPMLSQLLETPLYLALAEKGRDEAAVPRLLEEGLRRLDRKIEEQTSGARQLIGYSLPVVERIDPAMVPEFFWREVSSRQSFDNPRTMRRYSPLYLIRYLAWYDREVAAALFEPSRARIDRADDRELATWRDEFEAWSFFDPRGAAARIERVPVRHDAEPDANAARLAVAATLGLGYERRLRTIWSYREYVLDGTKPAPEHEVK